MSESILLIRYNIMEISSIDEFVNIRGGVNQNSKDVYFIRALGVNGSSLNDVEKMDRVLTERMTAGQGDYKRLTNLPGAVSMEMVAYYSNAYDAWAANGRKDLQVKACGTNKEWQMALGYACEKTLQLFKQNTPGVSESMEKNFAVKLLYWYDEVAKDFITDWNLRQSRKCVLQNISKKQEYLFCYFLTQMGVDVLLLQCKADIDEPMKQWNLSKQMMIGSFGECNIPDYQPDKYRQPAINSRQGNLSGSNVGGNGTPVLRMENIRRPERDRRTQERMQQEEQKRAQERVRMQEQQRAQERMGGLQHQPSQARPGMGMPSGLAGGQNTAGWQNTQPGMQPDSSRRELEFEELALLASSVVMIAIHNRRGDVIGTGSGIMIGREGYILTNNHVASGGAFYSVKIEDDNNVYETEEVIKYNPVLDLAIIRIQRTLQPIPVYRGSKKLVRGQKVVAIGSPLGMFNSVSNGIISGFRNIENVDMIQFTAPTSHGSSGGAVLNMYGEVIGISTAGMDRGQNINLAVGYECINNFIRGFV